MTKSGRAGYSQPFRVAVLLVGQLEMDFQCFWPSVGLDPDNNPRTEDTDTLVGWARQDKGRGMRWMKFLLAEKFSSITHFLWPSNSLPCDDADSTRTPGRKLAPGTRLPKLPSHNNQPLLFHSFTFPTCDSTFSTPPSCSDRYSSFHAADLPVALINSTTGIRSAVACEASPIRTPDSTRHQHPPSAEDTE